MLKPSAVCIHVSHSSTYCPSTPLQKQYVFIHDALKELNICGQTEIAAGDLHIVINKLSTKTGSETTGFQKQFEVSPCTFLAAVNLQS